jgi:hypothetical protein
MLVTVSTISVFVSMLRINIYENSFNWSEERHQKILKNVLLGRDYAVVIVIYAVFASAIIAKYGKDLFSSF